MPFRFLSYRTAIIVALVAYFCIPYPTGLGTNAVVAAPGFVRTLAILYDYIGLPEEYRKLRPIYRSRGPVDDNHHEDTAAQLGTTTSLIARSQTTVPLTPSTMAMANTTSSSRTPVYFLSHGGPSIVFDTAHPSYTQLQLIGLEITQKIKPKAIVVFSAHWQSSPTEIKVNTASTPTLIYDFSGFPQEYYNLQYPHHGSPQLAGRILKLLHGAGIQAQGVNRGLDHGVWAPFTCAFHPETNPLTVPIVQVSLFDSEDPGQHYALGSAMAALREEGVQVICSGMSVHNLRDYRRAGMSVREGEAMPYAVSFDEALKDAVEREPGSRRREAMRDLVQRGDAREAHPSLEHLLPVFVAAGAAGEDAGRRIWTMAERSLAWGQYRFG
ncbi:hypothetical protein LTR62_004724 [Meristemomyces frigidus]|uniref:Extradiol ring-cleavage dioxygenase class III enzyme subunit B domain-containing protein n=1 Tax=Meristemomyces frigidus TaxID=1508187 RepID=A0AAN7TEC6_9PEZI|nr:hypothetical protein LTR62_004724 [Meristemomyces frigidus]